MVEDWSKERLWTTEVPGLVLWNDKRESLKRPWRVLHEDSKSQVCDGASFKLKKEAIDFAYRIAHFTDWTYRSERLVLVSPGASLTRQALLNELHDYEDELREIPGHLKLPNVSG